MTAQVLTNRRAALCGRILWKALKAGLRTSTRVIAIAVDVLAVLGLVLGVLLAITIALAWYHIIKF